MYDREKYSQACRRISNAIKSFRYKVKEQGYTWQQAYDEWPLHKSPVFVEYLTGMKP